MNILDLVDKLQASLYQLNFFQFLSLVYLTTLVHMLTQLDLFAGYRMAWRFLDLETLLSKFFKITTYRYKKLTSCIKWYSQSLWQAFVYCNDSKLYHVNNLEWIVLYSFSELFSILIDLKNGFSKWEID